MSIVQKIIKKERPDRALLFHILIFALEILLVLIMAFLVSRLFFGAVTLQDNSMEPTYSSGNVMLMNKAVTRFGSLKRGDVIAYRTTDDPNEILHIKRVIGLPGETVEIRNGQIVIDGETYVEKREFPAILDAGIAGEPVTLADDEYFVLGDNRNGSQDSRYPSVGNVRNRRIAGRIWLRIPPVFKRGGN